MPRARYVAANANQLGHPAPTSTRLATRPHVTKIVEGCGDGFRRVVREDPERAACWRRDGARRLCLIDDGGHCSRCGVTAPRPVHTHDQGGDLVRATRGRSFWILDDIAPCGQLRLGVAGDAHCTAHATPTVWTGWRFRLRRDAAHPSARTRERRLDLLLAQTAAGHAPTSPTDGSGDPVVHERPGLDDPADSLRGDATKRTRHRQACIGRGTTA